MKEELSGDLTLVRTELKELLPKIKTREVSLKKANTIIYCCSNITRAVIAEVIVNKNDCL